MTFSGKRSGQRQYELDTFIGLLVAAGVRSYLEVGTRFGDTFHAVMSALPVGSLGVAVDLPDSKWGRGGSEHYMALACDDLRKKGYVIHEIYGDSCHPETEKAVCNLGPFDAALIDGDHTIGGVTADWEIYAHMCSIVALHDIAGVGLKCKMTGAEMGVPILWEQVKGLGRSVEIIEPGHKMGIGVLYRGEHGVSDRNG